MITTNITPSPKPNPNPKPTLNLNQPEHIELYFVNVGQGNCSLLKLYDKDKTKCHVWIIDAGSNHHPYNVFTLTEDKDKKNSPPHMNIRHFIGDSDSINSINVVISHFDEDHYNNISTVLSTLINKESIPIRFFTNLGKNQKLAQKKIFAGKKDEHYKIRDEKFAFFNWDGTLNTTKNGQIRFLNTDFLQNGDDNDNSLVVKFNFGIKGVIPGDATEKTLDLIDQLDLIDTDIFLLSHHGATNRFNTCGEFEYMSPKYIICSAHIKSKHDHPTIETVNEIQKYFNKQSEKAKESENKNKDKKGDGMKVEEQKYHLLMVNKCLKNLEIGKPDSKTNSEFLPLANVAQHVKKDLPDIEKTIFATTSNFYHTASNGTIKFSWKITDKKPTISFYEKKIERKDEFLKKETILKRLRFTDPNFKILALYLIGVTKKDPIFTHESLTKNFIEVLDISEFDINQIFSFLNDLFEACPDLVKVKVGQDQKEELKKILAKMTEVPKNTKDNGQNKEKVEFNKFAKKCVERLLNIDSK